MTNPVRRVAGMPPSTVHLPLGEGATVLDALCARFATISREVWLDRMRRGQVLDAQGRAIEPKQRYTPGMCVRYFREVPNEVAIPFSERVLHFDDDLLVVDKPHFLPVMPAGNYARETLLTRLIGRFDRPELVPLHPVGIVRELGELPGARERLVRNQVGHTKLAVAVRPGMHVEHPVDERTLEAGPFPSEKRKAGTGNLRTARQIEQAQRFPQLPVGPRREADLHGLAPLPHAAPLALPTVRHVVERQVGEGEKQLANTRIALVHDRVEAGVVRRHLGDTDIRRIYLEPLPGDEAPVAAATEE